MSAFASASTGVHVGLRLRPVDTSFYDLFTQSAQHLVAGAELLAEMLSESSDKDSVAERMRAAEHAADETTHEIVKKVNSTFVTPFDREDIYALGSGLDDVMDMMDEAVDLILLYEVQVALPAELSEQVEVLQRCAELTAAAMPRLQSMKSLEDYWIEINRLENTGDRNHRRTLAKLFSGEYPTIEVLKLKDIVESLESAIDAFERVANTVEQIAVKES
jgi:predicted phosphate transport protein (TIGR00153 family)